MASPRDVTGSFRETQLSSPLGSRPRWGLAGPYPDALAALGGTDFGYKSRELRVPPLQKSERSCYLVV